jgi:hypothetical protein
VEIPSPSYRACEVGFGEEIEAKKVTGSDQTLDLTPASRLVILCERGHGGHCCDRTLPG